MKNPHKHDAEADAMVAWQELRAAINRLNSLPPEVLAKVAAGRARWPVMAGLDAGATRDAEDHLRNIGLGSAIPVRDSKDPTERKGVDISVPINDLALTVIRGVLDEWTRQQSRGENDRDEIGSLPPFTKSTAREWAKVAWGIHLQSAAVPPERNSALRSIGIHKASKYVQNSAKRSVSRTRESNIRAGIAEAFCQACIRLARD